MIHLDFPSYDIHEDGSIWRNDGRYVYSGPEGPTRAIKPQNSNRYRVVRLVSKDGSRRSALVHGLVAAAYLGMDLYDKSLEPDHKDRIRSNNHKDNLEIVTRSENMRRAKGRKPNSVTDTHKQYPICGEMKLHEEFNLNSRSANGLGGRGRPCDKEYRESTNKGLKQI